MKTFRKASFYWALGLAAAVFCPAPLWAQTASDTTQKAPTYRDGQHDFDFNIGTWRTHIKTLKQPLSGSNEWTELTGTVTVRKIWGGKASMEEIEANGPDMHLEGATLFLYNPAAHQWSQTWVDSSTGVLEAPAIGEFKDGRGELINQETYHGRTVLVRTVWSDIKPDSHRFEQSFSDDNGKTWEPNFVANLTRIKS
jgi:hypothetical protein